MNGFHKISLELNTFIYFFVLVVPKMLYNLNHFLVFSIEKNINPVTMNLKYELLHSGFYFLIFFLFSKYLIVIDIIQ